MMHSLKLERIKCAEECVKLANQRFHLTQAIERLNVRVAMLREALIDELKSPSPQSGQVLHQTESDWLAQHDANIRDEALEDAANVPGIPRICRDAIRTLKGNQ